MLLIAPLGGPPENEPAPFSITPSELATAAMEAWRCLQAYPALCAPFESVYVLEQVRQRSMLAGGGVIRLRALHLGSPRVVPETIMQWTRADGGARAAASTGAAAALCALALGCCAPARLARGSTFAGALAAAAACVALCAAARARWRLDVSTFAKPYAMWSALPFALAPWAAPERTDEVRALMIGLGGGSLVHFWRALVPRIELDVVELSPNVIAAAAHHFDVHETSAAGPGAAGRLTLHCADGAAFVADAPAGTYRLVMCDLDVGALVESCADFRAALRPDGVLVVNMFLELTGARRLLLLGRALQALLANFAEVHIARTSPKNTQFLAFPTPSSLDRAAVAAAAVALCARAHLPFDLGALVAASDSYAIRRV